MNRCCAMKIGLFTFCACRVLATPSAIAALRCAISRSCASFLNSASNIEFVYLILLGINHFLDNLQTSDDGVAPNQRIRIEKNANETKIMMSNIKIKNLQLWDVD